jgi:hypothetical protein
MPSCVRAPCRTSELRTACSVTPPLVQTLALTLIQIARVVVTVRAYLSNFPNFQRVLLHPTLYIVASHEVLASRIHGAHRSRVIPPVERDIFTDTYVGLCATLYLTRHMQPHLCRKSWT